LLPLDRKNNEEKHGKEVRKDQKARNPLPHYPYLPVIAVIVHGDDGNKSKTGQNCEKEYSIPTFKYSVSL